MRVPTVAVCGLLAALLIVFHTSHVRAQNQIPDRTRDDADIRALVGRYVDARELKDPAAIEALFTPDADQHTTAGEWRRGRAEIVDGGLRSSAATPGTRTIRVETVRYLTADVAIADGPYEITAEGAMPRRMWATIVVIRDGGVWRITGIRNMVPTGGG